MSSDAIEQVRLRNNFYRDNYRRLVLILLLNLVLMLGLIGTIAYLVVNRPAPQYFATTSDGRLVPLLPLNTPNVTNDFVLQWATDVATRVYNFDYVHYRQQLQDSAKYFTQGGWENFMEAWKTSNNLERIEAKKYVVSGEPVTAPIVLKQGLLGARYAWQIQMNMLISYKSEKRVTKESLRVTMTVVRASSMDHDRGIAVDQFIAEQVRKN